MWLVSVREWSRRCHRPLCQDLLGRRPIVAFSCEFKTKQVQHKRVELTLLCESERESLLGYLNTPWVCFMLHMQSDSLLPSPVTVSLLCFCF